MFRGEHQIEASPHERHGCAADLDVPLVQGVLHFARRQFEPDARHHSQVDDLRANLEVEDPAALSYDRTLRGHPTLLKLVCVDRASFGHVARL